MYTYMNELINLRLIFSWDPLFPSFNLLLYLQWSRKMKRDCMYKYNMFLSWSYTCYCYGYSNICVLMQCKVVLHYVKYYPIISKANSDIYLSIQSIYTLFYSNQRVVRFHNFIWKQTFIMFELWTWNMSCGYEFHYSKTAGSLWCIMRISSYHFINNLLPLQILTLRSFNF